jgi:hypothetical protein
MIPGGTSMMAAASTTESLPTIYRSCGRFFSSMATGGATTNDLSVCCKFSEIRQVVLTYISRQLMFPLFAH